MEEIASKANSGSVKILRFTLACGLLVIAAVYMLPYLNRVTTEQSNRSLIFRDLTQDYVALQALKENINPYETIDSLIKYIFAEDKVRGYEHATPHSPFLLTLLWPLRDLSFNTFHMSWLIFSVCTIVLSLMIACYRCRSRGCSIYLAFLILGFAFLSRAVREDLHYGQHNSQLLLLATMLWISMSKGYHRTSGLLIGVCIALRGFGYPFLLLFIAEKRFKTLLIAALTFIFCYLCSLLIFPWDTVLNYFLDYSSQAIGCWHGHPANYSLLTLFSKFSGELMFGVRTPPVICYDKLNPALLLFNSAYIIILMAVIYQRIRFSSVESKFFYFLLLSVFLSPLTWPHYLLILFPVLVLSLSTLRQILFNRHQIDQRRFLTLTLFSILCLADFTLVWSHYINQTFAPGVIILPFWLILVSSMPTILALMLFLFGTSDIFPDDQNNKLEINS